MFTFKKTQTNTSNLILISDEKSKTKATINLSFGGSLQELILEGKTIILDSSENYASNYSSAILFPFVNRIDNGSYEFNGEKYYFHCNEAERNNAIHGLVYNKEFLVKEIQTSVAKVSITLSYIETRKHKGFPFTYEVDLNYILTNKSLSLAIQIKNTDTTAFPFTLGWHPYFYSSDLSKSTISFKSDQTILMNEKMITNKVIDVKQNNELKLHHKNYDDCYRLAKNQISFKTSQYQFLIETSSPVSYLQIYTPPNQNFVAIEPLTGVSDSFNNKEGLQTLASGETYNTEWNIKLSNQNFKY